MAEVRILAHMNKDHKVSVEDYLAVYGNVKLDKKVSKIKMTEIDLSHFSITFEHVDSEYPIEKIIPLEPPMESLNEARTRLVDMAKLAAEKRGYSPFQITDYKSPGPLGRLLILTMYIPLLSTMYPNLVNNLLVKKFLSQDLVDLVLANLLNITYFTVAIHLLETLFILHPKLSFYRVPIDFRIEWYISGLVEGYPAVRRFNELVAEKEH